MAVTTVTVRCDDHRETGERICSERSTAGFEELTNVATPVSAIDIAPTLVQIAGVNPAWTFDGRLFGSSWDAAVIANPGRLDDVADSLSRDLIADRWKGMLFVSARVDGLLLAAYASEGPAPSVIKGRAPAAPDEVALDPCTLERLHKRLCDTVSVAGPLRGCGGGVRGQRIAERGSGWLRRGRARDAPFGNPARRVRRCRRATPDEVARRTKTGRSLGVACTSDGESLVDSTSWPCHPSLPSRPQPRAAHSTQPRRPPVVRVENTERGGTYGPVTQRGAGHMIGLQTLVIREVNP
jgi:hypothetical protein